MIYITIGKNNGANRARKLSSIEQQQTAAVLLYLRLRLDNKAQELNRNPSTHNTGEYSIWSLFPNLQDFFTRCCY